MGMPATIEVVDQDVQTADIDEVFAYFDEMDQIFSTYKEDSVVEKIKRGVTLESAYPEVVREVLRKSAETKKETAGYFDIYASGVLDPSGLVKGMSIQQGALKLISKGYENLLVEIAGDVQLQGKNSRGETWTVGIKNPFNAREIIKVLRLTGQGVATSGTYIRGSHIINPITHREATEITSLTVIGPNIYEADRFATAAFAMGEKGLAFIDSLAGFEAYQVDKNKIGRQTGGFGKFVKN